MQLAKQKSGKHSCVSNAQASILNTQPDEPLSGGASPRPWMQMTDRPGKGNVAGNGDRPPLSQTPPDGDTYEVRNEIKTLGVG